MIRRFGALVGAALFAATAITFSTSPAVASAQCKLPQFGPGANYHPQFDASTFTPNVDNPMFPLTPGTTLVYTGTKDGKKALDMFAVTSNVITIDGVPARVVEDRLYLDNVLEERTSDYYSQDACGNVWYFGEDTAVLDKHGRVIDRSGSFRAGVDGAEPGVFMQARPEVNRRFRQEWYKGQAEDTFRAVDLSTPVKVPYGSFRHAMRTEESTDLEPAVLDNKYYVEGIGEVVETAVAGPVERLVLVDVIS
jgi:hypothetical protein